MVLKLSRVAEKPQQPSLFGGWANVHDAVTAAGGAKPAVEAAQVAALTSNAGSLPKALAGRSGRQIAGTASAALVRDLEGSGERGYSYSAWCLAGLPHREIPKDADWLIETGFARLLVRPGRRLRDDNSREDVIVNQRLIEAAEYVAAPDVRARDSLRIIERVLLSDAFYKELCRHPVLVDKAALHDLASSPLAIDIYLWLAFRLHVLQKEMPVGWEALHRPFGARVRLLKNFKSQFMAPLHLALSAYSAAKVRVGDRGLLLEPSPPPLSA